MIKHIRTSLLATVLLALPASAQGLCSTLSITTERDPDLPRQPVTIDVAGTTPGAPVFLAVGATQGTTTINLRPFGTLVLGLERPFSTTLIGVADANGDLERSYDLPSDLGLTRYAQSVAVSATTVPGGRPKPTICTSDVVRFDL